MDTFAALTTTKGTGAISTIQIFGGQAKAVLKKIFKPAGSKSAGLEPPNICLGTITDGTETIDQVTIGCEGVDNFAIHCHGNPLIVEIIMELLKKHGATLVAADKLRAEILTATTDLNSIRIEAKLAIPKARTLAGTRLIVNQIEAGLSKAAQLWLRNIDTIPLKQIKEQAQQILKAGQTAKLIINRTRVCLAGPPNTGKSTLLNCLTGKQKAIVTHIKGTTRDYVTGQCTIGPLWVELFDTAGLDDAPGTGTLDQAARQKAVQILELAELVLVVLDINLPAGQLNAALIDKLADRKVLPVLNKSDLPAKFDANKLPADWPAPAIISAKLAQGLDHLAAGIQQLLAVTDFDVTQPVWITSRQKKILRQLAKVDSHSQATEAITELLNGPVRV